MHVNFTLRYRSYLLWTYQIRFLYCVRRLVYSKVYLVVKFNNLIWINQKNLKGFRSHRKHNEIFFGCDEKEINNWNLFPNFFRMKVWSTMKKEFKGWAISSGFIVTQGRGKSLKNFNICAHQGNLYFLDLGKNILANIFQAGYLMV